MRRIEVITLAIFLVHSCTLCLGFTTCPSHINFMTHTAKKTTNLIRWSKEDKSNSEDNKGDEQQQPINNLDIFGQPKDKPRRKFEDEGDIRGPDRMKSCIPYMLPLIDGDSFGRFIYERFPPLGSLDYVLMRPFVDAFHAVPFLSIALFMVFAIGPQLSRDSLSREVRFNAQQAIFIDLLLLFPTLIGEAIQGEKVPMYLLEPSTNFVWIAYMSLVLYSVTSCLRGKKPDQIPFISSAAEMATGPF
mmetsp:Transcript_25875/g.42712  ORF Transcript_25875/g.42712 Transcript_25875/m.42712 type:complete len:246 (+) Transcript_25875:184-921(+)|eukprot:scaffold15872_cov145-Skeletonema_menzelii.AAC.5